MATIPESYTDILHKKAFAHFATTMPDGTPQVSPVWVDYADGKILINSAEGRLKDKNVNANPAVAVSITDPDNPYRALMVRGRVVEITREGADAHIDAMAKKYMDKDTYPYRSDSEVRVIYKIEPERVATMG